MAKPLICHTAIIIYNHAQTNHFGKGAADELVMFFCDEYVRRLQEYVGNEQALTFEITPAVATGRLQTFLQQVADDASNVVGRRLTTSSHVAWRQPECRPTTSATFFEVARDAPNVARRL